jgi:hypothetical protein
MVPQRINALFRMTEGFFATDFGDLRDLYGIGQFAYDSVRVVCWSRYSKVEDSNVKQCAAHRQKQLCPDVPGASSQEQRPRGEAIARAGKRKTTELKADPVENAKREPLSRLRRRPETSAPAVTLRSASKSAKIVPESKVPDTARASAPLTKKNGKGKEKKGKMPVQALKKARV